MRPIPITQDHIDAHLANPETVTAKAAIFGGPHEGPDVIPCPAIVVATTSREVCVRVPYKLDEIELSHLAQGGTLWLSSWSGLPVHSLDVSPPADFDSRG